MRTKKLIIWVMVVILVSLFMCPPRSFGTTYFDDGQVHDIDYEISGEVDVYDSLGGTPTVVNLLTGGVIRHNSLGVHDNSRVTIAGGSIEFTLNTFGSSQVTVSQGMIGDSLRANNNSRVMITDGVIGWNLTAQADSRISLYGGSIVHMLNAEDASIITVYGSGFNYSLGEILDSTGTLTGMLTNGDPIDNDFYVATNASIVLVPEPATLLLLGLGAVLLRKRR